LFARQRVRMAVAGRFLANQSFGLIASHPCQLSDYNLLVGGLHGADRLGFERTYWGDSVTRSLLRQVVACVPEGATVAVSPVLHQFQLDELLTQSPILRARGIRLVAASAIHGKATLAVAGTLLFCRKADLPAREFAPDPDKTRVRPPHVGEGQCWLAIFKTGSN
ncbi:MAG TPA: hypothetical protein VK137_17315, partial [Planctomycetaceae bacterium]|nr:hypothetical protein [Planctomycetaceae bacterium]